MTMKNMRKIIGLVSMVLGRTSNVSLVGYRSTLPTSALIAYGTPYLTHRWSRLCIIATPTDFGIKENIRFSIIRNEKYAKKERRLFASLHFTD
jgi:hypothetical protein